MNTKQLLPIILITATAITALIFMVFCSVTTQHNSLPLVAIANYGPHFSLDATIAGVKKELARQGFIEGSTVNYMVCDVGFDTALIPQMIAQLKSPKPAVMVVLTTPVAQCAKGVVLDIPLVFAAVTDPVVAGLLEVAHAPSKNMTGSSEKQNLVMLLDFARTLIPGMTRIGLLFGTGEANDRALVAMMTAAATSVGMEVVAVPVNSARDVPIAMQQFKGAVDLIYVGSSGPIQPTLPLIAALADQMGIPVLNVDKSAVHDGLVVGSFGVSFTQVGVNAGNLVAQLLNGSSVTQLPPVYPAVYDHTGLIHRAKAKTLGLAIPNGMPNVEVIG
ncbi:MAG: putative tryptophan/tyrosine transport system substrate-binding protein [Candidatus Dependentiae bacterium]|nr:putative tryptophan/tyrosine transport system substrate-binding protein [Candidatus Dependentiae bacterium]